MRRTALALVSLALAAALAPAASAQDRPDRSAEVREALARLPIAPGVWEGDAWYRRGPGAPDTIRQTERVETRLDGTVLLIEGTGRDGDAVVFHAFATLGYDPEADAYRMSTWLADGSTTRPDAAYEDGVFTWSFQPPGGPRIRYRIASPSDGVWTEEGEASMDGGETWHPFFGMTLRRTGDVEEGR